MCIPRATVSAVSCLVVPAFICIDLLVSRVLKINDDDDDDDVEWQAGIASTTNPDQLLIALEPEAASIYVRRQRLHQLLPEPEERALIQSRRAVTPEPIVVHHSLSESMKAGTSLTLTSKRLTLFLLLTSTVPVAYCRPVLVSHISDEFHYSCSRPEVSSTP